MAFPDLGKRRWAKREEMACGGYRIVLFGERAQAEENLVAGEVMVGKGCGYGRMPRQECQPPDTVSPTSDDGVPDDTTLTLEQECVPVACGQDIEWAEKGNINGPAVRDGVTPGPRGCTCLSFGNFYPLRPQVPTLPSNKPCEHSASKVICWEGPTCLDVS